MILFLLFITSLSLVFIIFSYSTIIYYYYSKKIISNYEKKIFPSVQLVIPFYNEESILKTKILDTSKIDYPQDKIEIIFLNDHSTDNSILVIKSEADILPFKWKIINNGDLKGKLHALNYLIPTIKKEIMIITDTDSLIKHDAITLMVQHFQKPDIGGVNSKLNIIKPAIGNKSYLQEMAYRKFYDVWRLGESNIYSISMCNGPLMAFRTDIIKDVVLKDKPRGVSADDTELTFNVVRRGFRVVYDMKSIVYEISPPRYMERLRQKMRRGFGILFVYLNNLDLLGRGKFGRVIYPITLLSYVVSPYLTVVIFITFLLISLKHPILFLLLSLFFTPKIGAYLTSFVTSQILIALSPLISRGWNQSKSSREMFIRK